jgi:molecular chaperone DnaJ
MAPQREWFEKDYYKTLGVAESATQKEITKAYRKLARELHPDANPDNAQAEERFKEVSAAYDVIGDDAKRKEYDEVRKMGPMGGMGFAPGGAGGQTFNFDGADLGDILGGLFNRGGAAGGRRPPGYSRGPGPQRGTDLETELHLSFEDSVRGVTTSVHLTSDAICTVCAGSGAEPGSTPVTCPTCGGRGVLDENQGFFSFSSPCPDCGGRGTKITDPCHNCQGTGVERRAREVKVRIPAGVNDGQRIKLKGRGGPGRNGGPTGDLYVVVHVAADPRFGRDGKNITITVPVTFPEAALGTKLRVPTLEGDTVTLKIPAGTASGKVFRVKGRGVEAKRGKGDLLVRVEVAVPNKLSKEQKQAVEALAAASPESPREHLGV